MVPSAVAQHTHANTKKIVTHFFTLPRWHLLALTKHAKQNLTQLLSQLNKSNEIGSFGTKASTIQADHQIFTYTLPWYNFIFYTN